MLRVARQYVPNQAIAEEVVQDSWVAVLRGIDAFRDVASLAVADADSAQHGPQVGLAGTHRCAGKR